MTRALSSPSVSPIAPHLPLTTVHTTGAHSQDAQSWGLEKALQRKSARMLAEGWRKEVFQSEVTAP